MPEYVPRDIDGLLRERVRAGGFVLLVGDSTAGKSRAAFEAIRHVRPEQQILVPRSRSVLPASVARAQQLGRCVLWLDDIERFLSGPDGLSPPQVARMTGGKQGFLILATLRAEERVRIESMGRIGDESNRIAAREIRDVLEMAESISLDRRFTASELRHAADTAAIDSRIATAVGHADEYGVAEYLAAGPQLLARWRDGWAPGQHPRGAALIAAAIDCRRAGVIRPAPRELLVRVHEQRLTVRGGTRLRPESLDEAFRWATESQQGTTALMAGDDVTGYQVFDCLVDTVQREATTDDRVPDNALRVILDYAEMAESIAITSIAIDYGWYDLALLAAQKATALSAELPPTNPDALTARHNLARVALWRGEYARARDEYAAVAEQRKAVLGPDHLDTLATRHDYAWTLTACGDYKHAEAEYLKIIADRTRVLGAEHALTLSSRHNLAWALFQKGDLWRAETEYRSVLDIRGKLPGRDNPHSVSTLHDLARVAAAQGRYDEAEVGYLAALDIRLKALGAEHPYVLSIRHNLAELAFAKDELDSAQGQFDAVLVDRTRILGPDHPHTLMTIHEVARLTARRGETAKAAEIYRALLPARTRMLGAAHPLTREVAEELRRLWPVVGSPSAVEHPGARDAAPPR